MKRPLDWREVTPKSDSALHPRPTTLRHTRLSIRLGLRCTHPWLALGLALGLDRILNLTLTLALFLALALAPALDHILKASPGGYNRSSLRPAMVGRGSVSDVPGPTMQGCSSSLNPTTTPDPTPDSNPDPNMTSTP